MPDQQLNEALICWQLLTMLTTPTFESEEPEEKECGQ